MNEARKLANAVIATKQYPNTVANPQDFSDGFVYGNEAAQAAQEKVSPPKSAIDLAWDEAMPNARLVFYAGWLAGMDNAIAKLRAPEGDTK